MNECIRRESTVSEESTLIPECSAGDLHSPVTPLDHIQGPDSASVTLVEYADYECPYSRRVYYGIKALQRELDDHVRLVYRNFPLREIHPHAQHAAEAAEAAAAQGKFWEMHDYLFEHQRVLDDAHLHEYAVMLSLDVERRTGPSRQSVRPEDPRRSAQRQRERREKGPRRSSSTAFGVKAGPRPGVAPERHPAGPRVRELTADDHRSSP